MVLDFLTGEFIDVIEWVDDTRDTMVWRFETRGRAIKYGAKLTVREGQAAVFVHEGQIADTFGPGLWMLEVTAVAPEMCTSSPNVRWPAVMAAPARVQRLPMMVEPATPTQAAMAVWSPI